MSTMMGRRRSFASTAPPSQQTQDVAAIVALLRKHKGFASAASFNMECLASHFHGKKGDGAEQDAATAECLEEAGALEAVVACLAAGTSSGDKARSNVTLVQAACKVLSRVLEVRPSSAVKIEAAGGLATLVQALKAMDADERPAEGLRVLGLMAEADPAYAAALVAGKGVDLLLGTLKASADDKDKARHAMLALGAIAVVGVATAAPSLACEAALPDVPRRTALGERVLKEMVVDRQTLKVTPRLLRTTTAKAMVATAAAGGEGRASPLFFAATDGGSEKPGATTAHSAAVSAPLSSGPVALLRAQVMVLLWLTRAGDEGGLTERMAQLGGPKLLVQAVGELEDQLGPADMLPAIGCLLHHCVSGPALDHARTRLSGDTVAQAIRALDAPPSSPTAATVSDPLSPASPLAALESSLKLLSAMALAPAGRAAIMAAAEEEDDGADATTSVLDGLLRICQAEASPYSLVKTALRTMERLAADARYGPLLLQRRALEVAMGVLRRDQHGECVDSLPLEVVAAAATLVACLTEIMALEGGGSPAPAPLVQDADALQLSTATHRRRQSMGWSDKKLEALRCAMTAHGRHPDSVLLFRSVVDLSLSYMRRAEQAQAQSHDEEGTGGAGLSPGELRLVQEAVAILQQLRGVESLPSTKQQHQQQLLADRLWGERGALACAGCLRLAHGMENHELAAAVVGLLDSTLAEDALPCSAAGETLHTALAPLSSLSEEAEAQRVRLVSVLGPLAAAGVEEEKGLAGNLDTSRASLFHDARAELMVTPPPALPMPAPAEPIEAFSAPAAAQEPALEEAEAEVVTAGVAALAVAAAPATAEAAAGPWVQCLDARRRVYFMNTETGQAQWEAPEETLAFWAAAAEQQGDAASLPLACEMDGWRARFDPATRVAFCEPPMSASALATGGPQRRYWCLPATAPPGLLGAGLLSAPSSTRRKEQEAAAAAVTEAALEPPDEEREAAGNPLLDADGRGNERASVSEGEEEAEGEEKPEPEPGLLDGLRALRDDLERVAEAHGQAQASEVSALAGRHAELLCRVRGRVARTDVEEGLSCALRKAVAAVETLAESSGYYIGMYERELQAHEGKGLNSALEATMGTVKGEIVRHTPADLPQIERTIRLMERQPPEKVFKESHLLVKRLVVEVGGKQGIDTVWTLSAVDIQTIPAHYLSQLGQALLRLCIAYDNLTPQQKKEFTTASEIIKNKSWLVALAVRCVEAGTLHAAAPTTTTSTFASPFSSTVRRMGTGATPPSGPKLLGGKKPTGASPPARSMGGSSSNAPTKASTISGLPHHRTPPSASSLQGSAQARRGRSPPLGTATTPSPSNPSNPSVPRRRTPPPPVHLSPPTANSSSPRDSVLSSPRGSPPPGSPPFLAGKAKPRTGAAGTAAGAGTPSLLGIGAGARAGAAKSGIKPPSTPVRGSAGKR